MLRKCCTFCTASQVWHGGHCIIMPFVRQHPASTCIPVQTCPPLQVPDENCTTAGLRRPQASKSCNQLPCPSQTFVLVPSPWGDCLSGGATPSCGVQMGTRNRTVQCLDGSGSTGLTSMCVGNGTLGVATSESCVVSEQAPCTCQTDEACPEKNQVRWAPSCWL